MIQPLSPRPTVVCPACQGPLQAIGRLPIRMESARTGILVPPQAGDTQPAVGVDAYRCHNCGRLELYDHDFLLPAT
jgi:hypothetical protein